MISTLAQAVGLRLCEVGRTVKHLQDPEAEEQHADSDYHKAAENGHPQRDGGGPQRLDGRDQCCRGAGENGFNFVFHMLMVCWDCGARGRLSGHAVTLPSIVAPFASSKGVCDSTGGQLRPELNAERMQKSCKVVFSTRR